MSRPRKKKKTAKSRGVPVIEPLMPETLFNLHRLGDEDFEEVCCNLLIYGNGYG
jgi:hypothetical protein